MQLFHGFRLSRYDADIVLNNGGSALVDTSALTAAAVGAIQHNAVFTFETKGTVASPAIWTITNAIAGDFDSTPGAAGLVDISDINNTTLFDVRDLGISNYGQIQVDYIAGVGAFDDAIVRSQSEVLNGTVTWEIHLIGVRTNAATDLTLLTEANFIGLA